MKFVELLKLAVKNNATDLVLKSGAPVKARLNGDLRDLTDLPPVDEDQMAGWIGEVLPERLRAEFNTAGDVDFRFQYDTNSRFRINLYRQRQSFAMVIRIIPGVVQKISDLGLPPVLEQISLHRRGLVLVTGATGSGKSTTLAAMVQHINRKRRAHIVTIEDPIEYEFVDRKSVVSQREVGIDVGSFEDALRSALRQNPDVIVVGELRDKITIETALKGAETGHLVLGTLHTSDSVEALTRLMSYFPVEQHQTVRMQLASALHAVVSQRLVKSRDKSKIVVANEIMLTTPHIRDVILRGDSFAQIYDAIGNGTESEGMLSFDDSLLKLYEEGVISSREALRQASRPNDLRLRMSGIGA